MYKPRPLLRLFSFYYSHCIHNFCPKTRIESCLREIHRAYIQNLEYQAKIFIFAMK